MRDSKFPDKPKSQKKTEEEKMDVAALMELLDRNRAARNSDITKSEAPPPSQEPSPPSMPSEEKVRDHKRVLEDVEEMLKALPAHGKSGKLPPADLVEDDPMYKYEGEWRRPGVNKALITVILTVIISLIILSYYISQENIEYSDDEIAILKDKKRKAEDEITSAIPYITNKNKNEVKEVVKSAINTGRIDSREILEGTRNIVTEFKPLSDDMAEKLLELLRRE